MRSAFVLLSGGMDSTTCLYKAIADIEPASKHSLEEVEVRAFSIDYGQRHIKETEYAARICSSIGIPHEIIKMPGALGNTMLTNPDINIPSISYSDIQGVSPTYVPFRNGFMLSTLAAKAQAYCKQKQWSSEDAVGIYFGAHAEDAANWAYPDCTPEFIGAMANAIYIGTYRQVRLVTPLTWLAKWEIVLLGRRLGVPWKSTWSCYKGEELHCGICPTCRSRRDAFKQAGVDDPTLYANRS